MTKLRIKNIGPVKDVELNLNRVNVFIGPQSCGKSTIAKIISFCSWLEKDVSLNQDEHFVNRVFIEKQLLAFHQMESYFHNQSSFIDYEGDVIHFSYRHGEEPYIVRMAGFDSIKIGKIAYIPSERNIVSLPGIASLPLPANNIRSFLFDWLNMHTKYKKENPVRLLDFDMTYYYNDDEKVDKLLLNNGIEISIGEASSGVQSVIPLYVYLHYLTEWIYQNQEDISFEKKKKFFNLLEKSLLRDLKHHSELETYYMEVVKQALLDNKPGKDSPLSKLVDALSKPAFSDIIIEEPEQNLFPQTQVALTYDILKMINSKRDMLIITTHSPYILYALNNCMLGWKVKENIPEEDREAKKLEVSFINPEDVSVWQIGEGVFKPETDDEELRIQDKDGLIRNNYFDKIMHNVMADFNSLINYYD